MKEQLQYLHSALNYNQMKELLLKGLSICAEHKASPEDWVGYVSIHVSEGGMGIQPKVVVDGNIPIMEYDIEDIDDAIKYFNSEVFTEKNLRYKHLQAMLNVLKVRPDIDLEIEADMELYEKERQWLITLERY
jgi:hypothetical protein